MKIAICDDDIQITTQLEALVEQLFPKEQKIECDVFLSAEELISMTQTSSSQYHIYLLDIEMREMNGMQLAHYIREKDNRAVIIFITSHHDFIQEAFDVQAFHYLSKPLHKQKVKEVIQKAVTVLTTNQAIFQFKKRKSVYTLFVEDIEYFESYKRKIKIYTKDKAHDFYATIKEVLDTLPIPLFAQVHISYIINLEKVRIVKGDSIILKSGTIIPLSRKYYSQFNEAYQNFVLARTPL